MGRGEGLGVGWRHERLGGWRRRSMSTWWAMPGEWNPRLGTHYLLPTPMEGACTVWPRVNARWVGQCGWLPGGGGGERVHRQGVVVGVHGGWKTRGWAWSSAYNIICDEHARLGRVEKRGSAEG